MRPLFVSISMILPLTLFAQNELNGPFTLLQQFRNPAMTSFDTPNTLHLYHNASFVDGFQQQRTTLTSEFGGQYRSGWTYGLLVDSDYRSEHLFRLRFGFMNRDCRPAPTHNVNRRSFGLSIDGRLQQLPDGTSQFLPDINFGYAEVIRNFSFGVGTSTLSSTLVNDPRLAPTLNVHAKYMRILNRKYTWQTTHFLGLNERGLLLRSALQLARRWSKWEVEAFWQSDHSLGVTYIHLLEKCKNTYECKRIHLGMNCLWNYQLNTLHFSAMLRVPFFTFAGV